MYSNHKPMSQRPDLYEEYGKTRMERTPSGSEVAVTRYEDGSSTVHWGGPCGSTSYDENGEEC